MATYDLTTSTAVKSYLDISASTWDTLLGNLITQCTEWIEGYCGGRRFVKPSSAVTEYYDGDRDDDGRTILFLKSYPIVSITSISYMSGAYNAPTWNLFDAASYYLPDTTKNEVHFAELPVGRQNIKVIYTAGYESASLPNDLVLACIQLVARQFNKRKSQGVLNESVGGASLGWSNELDIELRKTLNRYRSF